MLLDLSVWLKMILISGRGIEKRCRFREHHTLRLNSKFFALIITCGITIFSQYFWSSFSFSKAGMSDSKEKLTLLLFSYKMSSNSHSQFSIYEGLFLHCWVWSLEALTHALLIVSSPPSFLSSESCSFLLCFFIHTEYEQVVQSRIVGRSNNTLSNHCTYSIFAEVLTTTSKLHCFHVQNETIDISVYTPICFMGFIYKSSHQAIIMSHLKWDMMHISNCHN